MGKRPRLTQLRPRLAELTPRLSTTTSSWRGGKTTGERGYTYRWQQAREAFLRAHPLCRMCEESGHVVASTTVDHIEPHRGNEVLFWDTSNWQALCTTCHSSHKQREEAANR